MGHAHCRGLSRLPLQVLQKFSSIMAKILDYSLKVNNWKRYESPIPPAIGKIVLLLFSNKDVFSNK